ncbi:S1 domain-containing RNA-binding protein [Numidum massiliense]|uniref:S1 domain-containing RNA-binding protein n=1 Tax=Numidum massiliense TaxID=1522315 RepID=UPI0006D52BB8|nr:S1 domain-containing RNA-binding protein [Numidum massiliense]
MTIDVGSKYEGKVTGITHFGAFVELPGGKTGLVHISEVADQYVKDVKDHLSVGDTVTVKVMNVDDNGKIGLSIRKAQDRPPKTDRRSPRRDRSFEDKLSRFMKDSEDRLTSLRRHTEGKRGGRGARRG